jgi:hypothetical protein
LVYGSSNTPIGDIISVGKDQFLKEASFDPQTQKLKLVMYTADGSTTEIEIDFSSVVIEAEAGKGLYIDSEDDSLNVGVDNTSESVTISDGQGGSTIVPVLSVGDDSIKVSNIQAAINYATDTLAAELNNALNSVSAGNDAIEVSIKSNKSQTIGVKLDTTTTSGQHSYVSATGNALKITDDGLYLSGNWDCGTY